MCCPTDYVGGFLGVTLHGLPVQCKPVDLAIFNPPPGQTCLAYAGEWVASSGGYLINPNASADCKCIDCWATLYIIIFAGGFCPFSNGTSPMPQNLIINLTSAYECRRSISPNA